MSNDTTTRSDTPQNWNEVQDARSMPGAGTYPNYTSQRTRSGHLLMMDDSKGAENITIQHRGGSMIQMTPDGKVHIRANKGQHTVVFGENRMYVTGAYDITVDGAASMRVKKDLNINGKNVNFTASGDVNIKGKNVNLQPSGKLDIAGSSVTIKSNSNISMEAHGAMGLFSEGGFSAGSKGAQAVLIASKDVGIESKGGRLIAQAGTGMSLKAGQKMSLTAEGKLSVKSSGTVAMDGSDVKIQNGASEAAEAQGTITFSNASS